MAATGGRESHSLVEQLFAEPHRFDFFQAVRLLERAFGENGRPEGQPREPVGLDASPSREVIRFRALPSLSFPGSSIASARRRTEEETYKFNEELPPEMEVTFLGLTGPNGVLPDHYTAMLMERLGEKDYSYRDWLDLFNHRVISLFFRAWEKYHFYLGYERAELSEDDETDLFTQCLHCLVGLGTPFLRNRMEVSDEAILYYSGHFAHFPRSAIGLESILQDYFGLPVEVEQFSGRWLYLNQEDRSITPTRQQPLGQRCQLGVSLIAGARVWDTQSKFRLRIGPLDYDQFCRLMPGTGDMLRPLYQLVRLYVGPEFDFDVQPILKADQVPAFTLSAGEPEGARLGWNTWARGRNFEQDAKDVVFLLDDV